MPMALILLVLFLFISERIVLGSMFSVNFSKLSVFIIYSGSLNVYVMTGFNLSELSAQLAIKIAKTIDSDKLRRFIIFYT